MRCHIRYVMTTFAQWLSKQPTGTATRCMWETHLSWATISRAKRGDSIAPKSAQLISDFTGGAVAADLLLSQNADKRRKLTARGRR